MGISFERKRIEENEERAIVTGMIVSTEFLRQIMYLYNTDFFSLDYAKTISKWCVDYFSKYDKAPFKDLQSIFEIEKQKMSDEESIKTIASFLSSLDKEFVDNDLNYNVEYNLDKATNYFRSISLDNLIMRIKGAKIINDLDKAESEIAKYMRVTKNHCEGVDVWQDKEQMMNAIRASSVKEEDSLFLFPGRLGRYIRPWKRSDFVALIGPAKRGKSFWLLEIAYLSSLLNLNVAFFSFEMSAVDNLLRIYQRLTGRPLSFYGEETVEVMLPYFMNNDEGDVNVGIEYETKEVLNGKELLKKVDYLKNVIKNSKFKLICAPPNSMSVSDINNHLDNMEHFEGFVPDVIISDYADITKPERNIEKRHQIDETWLAYRNLSLARNALVVTASHSNKATFERDVRQGDLAEDNRKLNHVTWAGALNQTNEEADQGVMRLSTIVDRFARFSKSTEAVILQALDIGNPRLDAKISEKFSA